MTPPPPNPPATTPPPTTTSPPAAPAETTRTITAKGGTVAVRYASGRVTLMWARPNDGFEVDVAEDGPDSVEVEFTSDEHRSRIRASYDGDEPSHRVEEDSDDDDGDDGDDGDDDRRSQADDSNGAPENEED